MILLFGVRPGKTRSFVLRGVPCPNCHTTGQLTASSTPSFIHLFWIPVYRLGTDQLVECGYCKRGFHKPEFTTAMKQAISDHLP